MTFSAPKSVSVMTIVGGDEKLVVAHEAAVREALEEAEKYSATRVRLAGLNENRSTRNWIVASYTQDTSRQLDRCPLRAAMHICSGPTFLKPANRCISEGQIPQHPDWRTRHALRKNRPRTTGKLRNRNPRPRWRVLFHALSTPSPIDRATARLALGRSSLFQYRRS